ncbi:hypothetical protein U1839_10180 [Sphingomonas sp. RT2P30]|uniref:hypothetical protein n=1 Tax=Parasphingomonas halimpatiens TaxID=3096162 RepID=UPI002FC981D0
MIIATGHGSASVMSSANDSWPRDALYFIREGEERWFVSHSGAQYPYRSRHIAIEAAVDAANSSGKRGHHAQVLVRDGADDWQPIWTYGLDSYSWAGDRLP